MRKDTPSRPPFRRLLIANRGEIAIRIIRACRELGIESVAVYSEADAHALHVDMADRAMPIGPASAAESYLNVEALVRAARESGAEAVHPGYGFLSENAAFAAAVQEAGLVWIGPPPATQAALGDKLAARRSVSQAGVPVVPGLLVPLDGSGDVDLAEVGFPAMLKAAAGGGGRGMRRLDSPGDLAAGLQRARREAEAAFGDGTLYLERLISPARHVEVQLLGDHHGRLAVLGERECSVQRRHQKLVEESPSPAVTPGIREALFESARRVAGTVEFHNAATVEFLLDAAGNHYFLEMNTRLQVEHGVTELVSGVDIVAWQIRIAAGERLPDEVLHATPRGHAIEVRLYAEDPYAGFRPVGGAVTTWRLPDGPGIRVDAAVKPGLELTPEYDPLLAKLMVHAADRPAAVDRLRRALDETLIGGLQTDLGFHRWLVDQPEFRDGVYDTSLVATRWGHGPELSPEDLALAAAAARRARLDAEAETSRRPAPPAAVGSRWAEAARREALRR
ncbi:MAG TPA: biotin carboxylase N-terminal domain-containing protein [candidate division Zixibacteria bacterium]|nr:biotin carboxylase N-terminal domain-containing protein [candidate division Zixibacteria bacterium]